MMIVSERLVTLSLSPHARPLRFLLVGLTGVGVSSLVLWLLVGPTGRPTALEGFAAGVISTFTNFLLNDIFTWRDRRSTSLRIKAMRLVRYYSTTAVGNLITLGVLLTLTHRLGIFYLLANVMAIGVGGSFNYLMHNVWTWRRGEKR